MQIHYRVSANIYLTIIPFVFSRMKLRILSVESCEYLSLKKTLFRQLVFRIYIIYQLCRVYYGDMGCLNRIYLEQGHKLTFISQNRIKLRELDYIASICM